MKLLSKIQDKIIKKVSPKHYQKILLKRAITEAKTRWIKTGKRHYVMSVNDEYIVFDKSILKRIRRKNGRKWTAIELLENSVYVTPQSTFHNI